MDRINELNAVFEKAVKEAYDKGLADGQKILPQLLGKGFESIKAVKAPLLIKHEGLTLRKVDRTVCDGDYVKVEHENGECFKPGKVYGPVIESRVKADSSTGKDKYEEAGVYNAWYGRYESTVEIFEVVESNPVIELQDLPKTPNQQRYETIQRAREFVEGQKSSVSGIDVTEGGKHRTFENVYVFDSNEESIVNACNAEFVRKDNRITCLLKGATTGTVYAVGRSECSPSDVFNSDIGKAIALARALEIDVPVEFLRAVQPDKKVEGMKVLTLREEVRTISNKPIMNRNTCEVGSYNYRFSEILEDSDAVYTNE